MTPPQQIDQDKPLDNAPWYALRIFNNRHKAIIAYLQDKQLEVFVPQEWVDYVDKNGSRRRELRPIVYNLAFIKKKMDGALVQSIVDGAPSSCMIYRKLTDKSGYYEISAREMREFQQMCNPEIAMREYLSEEEAHLKQGAKVEVVHGPLKGITGRLVRISKKYYLLKEVPGMGIALKVSRWCCRAVREYTP